MPAEPLNGMTNATSMVSRRTGGGNSFITTPPTNVRHSGYMLDRRCYLDVSQRFWQGKVAF
jgi:hypothetical protein